MATSNHPDTVDMEEQEAWNSWNDCVEQAIDEIGEFLVNNLSVSDLVMYMDLDVKLVRRLHHIEHAEGKPDEAAKELLKELKKSSAPDRWTSFINALKEVSGEDSIILHYLFNRKNTDPWLDSKEHRKLISLFKEPLSKHVDIKVLMPRMVQDGLISDHHQRTILAKLETGNKPYAQMELIFAMQSYKVNWYRKFITILYNNEHTKFLAENIDPDFCREKLAEAVREKESEESRHQGSVPLGTVSLNDDRSNFVDGMSRGPGNEHSDPNHEQRMDTSNSDPREPRCGGCAQLLMEVAFLRSSLVDMHTEVKEMKQLLVEFITKGSR